VFHLSLVAVMIGLTSAIGKDAFEMVRAVDKVDPFTGCWRVLELYNWSSEYFDIGKSPHFTFDGEDGEFVLGEIEGTLDVRYGERGEAFFADFSWDGEDMGAIANGRGWLTIITGSRGFGHLYVHKGDHFEFVCKRKRRTSRRLLP